jgi:antitoxin MazE
MTATIPKWGSSLALRIPLPVAKQIHVQEGDAVSLKVGPAGLTVKALPKHPSLDELLAQLTPESVIPPRNEVRTLIKRSRPMKTRTPPFPELGTPGWLVFDPQAA